MMFHLRRYLKSFMPRRPKRRMVFPYDPSLPRATFSYAVNRGNAVDPRPGMSAVIRIHDVQVLINYLDILGCDVREKDKLPIPRNHNYYRHIYERGQFENSYRLVRPIPQPDYADMAGGRYFTIFVGSTLFLAEIERILSDETPSDDVIPVPTPLSPPWRRQHGGEYQNPNDDSAPVRPIIDPSSPDPHQDYHHPAPSGHTSSDRRHSTAYQTPTRSTRAVTPPHLYRRDNGSHDISAEVVIPSRSLAKDLALDDNGDFQNENDPSQPAQNPHWGQGHSQNKYENSQLEPIPHNPQRRPSYETGHSQNEKSIDSSKLLPIPSDPIPLTKAQIMQRASGSPNSTYARQRTTPRNSPNSPNKQEHPTVNSSYNTPPNSGVKGKGKLKAESRQSNPAGYYVHPDPGTSRGLQVVKDRRSSGSPNDVSREYSPTPNPRRGRSSTPKDLTHQGGGHVKTEFHVANKGSVSDLFTESKTTTHVGDPPPSKPSEKKKNKKQHPSHS